MPFKCICGFETISAEEFEDHQENKANECSDY